MMKERINLVIVDDHPGVRKGISNILRTTKDIVVVGEAKNGEQAIELAEEKNPHIILLDVELPDIRGDVVLQRIHKLLPDVKVLAISAYKDRQYIYEMMKNGAAGYLIKDEVPAMLVNAIRAIIYEDRDWIDPSAIEKNGSTSIFEQTLTQKEMKILKQLMIDGSETAIALSLNLDGEQVRKYLELLMNKYQASSISELKSIARQILPDS